MKQKWIVAGTEPGALLSYETAAMLTAGLTLMLKPPRSHFLAIAVVKCKHTSLIVLRDTLDLLS